MQPAIIYPACFLFRKWTLIFLISFDLVMILYNTFALMGRLQMIDEADGIAIFRGIKKFENFATNFTNINSFSTEKPDGELGLDQPNFDNNFNGTNEQKDAENYSNSTSPVWIEVFHARVYQRPKILAQVMANLFAYVVCLIGLIGVLRDNYLLTVVYAWFGCFSLASTIMVYFWTWVPELIGKILSNILFLILLFMYLKDLAAIRLQLVPNVVIVA